jgi:DNA-directed RNA polymerase specialized sigma24 family protein
MDTLDTAAAVSNAITTFLRGVERRAAVLAELHAGDAAHGDQALATVIATFAVQARETPEVEWPRTFWTLLLESPTLNTEPLAPFWAGEFAPLARLDSGPRAALLLRLVAQLDDQQAAVVFGVDVPSYRQALQGALPQRADGNPDGEAWLAMRDQTRYAVEDMSVDRLAAIARVREAAVSDSLPSTAAPEPQSSRVLPQIPGLAGGLLSRLRSSLR